MTRQKQRRDAAQVQARLRTLMRPRYGITLENEAPPKGAKPKRTWKVDWTKVAEAERWLATQRASRPADTGVAEATIQALRVGTAEGADTRGREAHNAQATPESALNILGVLVNRCAGHRDCPQASEVVEGIANPSPTELMEKMERWIDAEAIPAMRGVHQWMREVEEDERRAHSAARTERETGWTK